MEPECSSPYSQVPATCLYAIQVRGKCSWFTTKLVVSTSPNPHAGGSPLVGCPRLLIQYIRRYPPYCRPFLHPQPEEAPCRGDRDPLIATSHCHLTPIIPVTHCTILSPILVIYHTLFLPSTLFNRARCAVVARAVSPTHRPPLPPRKYSWYSFLLEAESTPGP